MLPKEGNNLFFCQIEVTVGHLDEYFCKITQNPRGCLQLGNSQNKKSGLTVAQFVNKPIIITFLAMEKVICALTIKHQWIYNSSQGLKKKYKKNRLC